MEIQPINKVRPARKYKLIIGVSILVLIFGVIVVMNYTNITMINPYLVHLFSNKAGEPFYKENQVISEGNTYLNDKYKISIWYPDLYAVEDNIITDEPYTVVATLTTTQPMKSSRISKGNDMYPDGMAIVFFDIPKEKSEISLNEVLTSKKKEYAAETNISMIDSGNIILGNVDGQYLLYAVKGVKGGLYTQKEVFAIKNGKLFDLTFVDAEDEFPVSVEIADKMFQSFIIK